MSKKIINMGHSNKVKYKEDDTFVLIKTKNGFNHFIDYEKLSEFDFVPKLIDQTDDKLVWEWIEGEILSKPSDEDIEQIAEMLRTLHKSDVKFPRNNLRRRSMSYIKKAHEKGIKWPEIEDNFKDSFKIFSRMGRLNPCHNDPWGQNIIKDKNGKLWLVDWEYATMGDKHFDLSFFIESMDLTKEQERIFLDKYNSFDDYQAYIPDWMEGYKKLAHWITLCWAAAQDKIPFPLDKIKKRLKK